MTWERYACHPQFVLGFHGCDRKVGEAILAGKERHLEESRNNYDWLGYGVYFWEDSPQRAMEFAEESAAGGRNSKGKIKEPFVLGAVINLGRCLNLMDRTALEEVRGAHAVAVDLLKGAGTPIPTNGKDFRTRNLDCMVFEWLHDWRTKREGCPPYDTVRGLFFEGDELYPGAGIQEKDHIQLCVRNRDCILGYFKPIE